MFGPTLEGCTHSGNKVKLRAMTEADAETLLGFISCLEVTQFMGRTLPPTLDQEKEWVKKTGESETTVQWGIELDGVLVGTIGLDRHLDRGTGTLGAMIGVPKLHSCGVMKVAGQLARDYIFTHLTPPVRQICGGYIDGNDASKRVQERAGFRECGRLPNEHFRVGRWRDHVIMLLTRGDWEEQTESVR